MPNYRLVALSIVLIFLGYEVLCSDAAPRPNAAITGVASIFYRSRNTTTGNATRQTFITHDDNGSDDNAPSSHIQVREVLPTELQNDIDPELNNRIDYHYSSAKTSSQSRNRRIWWRREHDAELQDSSLSTKKSKGKHEREKEEEHPLRTDLWKLQIQWFRREGQNGRSIQSERHLQMEFHKNGQCRLMSVNDGHLPTTVWGVGTWMSRPYAVSFSVPCKEFTSTTVNNDNDDGGRYNTKYIFTAQLHHNPFGKQPKFQQGTILLENQEPSKPSPHDVLEYDEERDRLFVPPPPKRWFRPVVGKFTGEGIGVDTLDYSYSKRK